MLPESLLRYKYEVSITESHCDDVTLFACTRVQYYYTFIECCYFVKILLRVQYSTQSTVLEYSNTVQYYSVTEYSSNRTVQVQYLYVQVLQCTSTNNSTSTLLATVLSTSSYYCTYMYYAMANYFVVSFSELPYQDTKDEQSLRLRYRSQTTHTHT
jgi:hypothetical protein